MTGRSVRLRPVAGLLALLGFVIAGVPSLGGAVVRAQEQVLFLSITDADGVPVTDVTAGEVVVRWDGEDSDIRRMELIDWPVRVTVFIDNSVGGSEAVTDVRAGMKDFLDVLPGGVEVGMLTLAGRPQWIVRHTTDRDELLDRVDLVVPDTGASSYLDGLVEEAERLSESDADNFPIIVMVCADGPDSSGSQQQKFETAMRRLVATSTTVHTRMLSHGNEGALQAQVASAAAESTQGSFETLRSGSAFRTMLPELAREIARKHELVSNQYRVTYRPPSGASAQPTISVGTTRAELRPVPTIDGNVPVSQP